MDPCASKMGSPDVGMESTNEESLNAKANKFKGTDSRAFSSLGEGLLLLLLLFLSQWWNSLFRGECEMWTWRERVERKSGFL